VFIIVIAIFFSQTHRAQPAYRTTLQPSLTISEEYTDNVNLTEDNRESDWITVISPNFVLNVAEKNRELNLSYAPGFTYYAENEEDSTIRHTGSLNAWSQLTKHLELNFDNFFSRTEKPYETIILALSPDEQQKLGTTDYTLRQNREPHSTYVGEINLDYEFGKKDSIGLGYRLHHIWDENPGAEDSNEHSPFLRISYWPTLHWGTEYYAEFTRGEFSKDTDTFDKWSGSAKLIRNLDKFLDVFFQYEHTIMDFKGDTEDYKVYDPSIGFNWQFAKDGNVSFNLGYFIKDNEDSNDDSDLSISGDISKGFDINRRTSFRITGGSGYEETYFGAENLGFTIYYQGQGRLIHSLSKHLVVDFSVDFRRNEYRDQDPEREDEIWSFQAGLNWQFREWSSLSLNDVYRIVDSNFEEQDYKENRIMLSLNFLFGPYLMK
jgi:uncharacterized protein (PEP-CTERM system associated)